jgi:GrpB-like predicted nucleotidyltransferase (UPF0157 family)
MRVRLATYSESWPTKFEQVHKQIQLALGTCAKRIEHIGSTAVPGLAAKPVIDILLELDNITNPTVHEALAGGGFAPVVEEPGHRMFRSPDRDVHVHAWPTGDPEVQRHLLFRDWLRSNEADRRLYEMEKRRLAALEWPTQNDYAQAKSPIINEILARARESRKR